jgi:hypothetical protein
MLFSPSHDAIEFIGRAMPAVQPEPKFSDPSPLMSPVPIRGAMHDAGNPRGLLVVSMSLFAVAAGVLVFYLKGAA